MSPDYITVSGTTDAFTQVFADLNNPAPAYYNPYDAGGWMDNETWYPTS